LKSSPLYRFVDADGGFRVESADGLGSVYFPIANELGLLSAITPDLAGDIKLDQHTFFNLPVSFEDLHLSRSARNFWIVPTSPAGTPWSVCGRSVWQRAGEEQETSTLEAGFLWQKLTRLNRRRGLEATVTSFVPAAGGTFEIMRVEIKNTSRRPIKFVPVAAVPMYGRSADNLRDHRHVTSLLHRLEREPFGLTLRPTMTFNERGHLINHTEYFTIGADDAGKAPTGVFPTVESFIGLGGDLERPAALLEKRRAPKGVTADDQGKEAFGGLAFAERTLKAGETAGYTILLGVDREPGDHARLICQNTGAAVAERLAEASAYWSDKLARIRFSTGQPDFDRWMRWVQVQPTLRRIYGCSFLPDFDYGRGGRGWRDLWQDCLALLLADPQDVRDDMLRNFGGVRIDGSNATIIGRKKVPAPGHPGFKFVPEFIADRNNIVRTWMDHGIWPQLTALLYVHQTGDWKFLLEEAPYFQDALRNRGRSVDKSWKPSDGDSATQLKTFDGQVYTGTVLEHMLVQNLVQFFNVGEHNIIKLEDADWNDGLDMAHERGESVAFTALYGGNLEALADTLEMAAAKAGWTQVEVAEELLQLLDRARERVDYDSVDAKRQRLAAYFESIYRGIKGDHASVPVSSLVSDLREKAAWIRQQINRQEWVTVGGAGWYNGYYDNAGRRVEGKGPDGHVRMTLSGQVYPVMAGIADEKQIKSIVSAVNRYLRDAQLGGVRLNTNFGDIQPDLGRAFSFSFGEKENGAIFSHMAVMYANALYRRRFSSEGNAVLGSLHDLAKNSARSRIFPGLPEYFNNQGRGRYAYLTGSASWYVLTLLTQVFGVRGQGGDLLVAPQLVPAQFDAKGKAAVQLNFAGCRLTVNVWNPKRVRPEDAEVVAIRSADGPVPFSRPGRGEALIQREIVAQHPSWTIDVEIGKAR
jgi:cellobiose phosphorylase